MSLLIPLKKWNEQFSVCYSVKAWCFMVLPTKIISYCAGPLACSKYLSHPWGAGWSCDIYSMVLHGSSYQDKLSLCRLDFQKSPSSDFIWRGTKDFSYLIGANFTDPKTGRCAWTNQSSSQRPLGIKLSPTSTKCIETWLAVPIPTWRRLRSGRCWQAKHDS